MTASAAMLTAILLSLLAGSAVFIGAFLASIEHIRPKWLADEFHHMVTALAAGALLAAIALVLVPQGMDSQPLWSTIITMVMGGFAAMMIDRLVHARQGAGAQLIAMVMDFVPETIVIGAIITSSFHEALLMAVIIFVQNLPESFIAFREIHQKSALTAKTLLVYFSAIAVSGPLYVVIGFSVLGGQPLGMAMVMTFCAGGILYLIFNDIAPNVRLENASLPPMGALIGFLIGVLGYGLIH